MATANHNGGEHESGEDRGDDHTPFRTENLPVQTGIDFPDALPLLRLKNQVVFPLSLVPLHIGDPEEALLIGDAVKGHRLLAMAAVRNPKADDDGLANVFDVGCIGRILQVQSGPGGLDVVVQSVRRFRIEGLIRRKPYTVVRVKPLAEPAADAGKAAPVMRAVKMQMATLINLSPHVPNSAIAIIENVEDPSFLADLIASNLAVPMDDKQRLLATLDPEERIRRLMYLVQREIEQLQISTRIQQEVKDSFDTNQREFFLRQQLKAIQSELGEGDPREAELERYRKAVADRAMPDEVKQELTREINRLQRTNEASADYHVITTYLDTLLELPWDRQTAGRLDIAEAERILNDDHFGLDKVKKRIIEYLAVRKLKPDAQGPILCFVGPPGVGKTSLGKSIARALGRNFVRMALGGMRDEAEIRGHRKTYVGALPGRIINGLRKAGSCNPVFMLDEIDKIGSDFRGDPSSALLEVLDPAQNNSFTDHYLNVPFDLSRVMFIATANVLDTVPWALRDRMETIELPGYTLEEKVQIARRYLVPRQLEAHGLTPARLRFTLPALRKVVADYTREAGVRNLDREIANVCRGCAKLFASGRRRPIAAGPDALREYLGNPKNYNETAERTRVPGVVTGLAWTAAGGDILFIEATRMPGKGELILTGQLGEVMKESARAALSYVQSNAAGAGIPKDAFAHMDLHLHVPAGAVPKDGPSAGVAMLTAIVSLLLQKPVRPALAMTGEITLRGIVLPVGGIKEKVLAAARASVKTLILPERNRNDYDEVPPTVRAKLRVHFVKHAHDVLHHALGVAHPPAKAVKRPQRRLNK